MKKIIELLNERILLLIKNNMYKEKLIDLLMSDKEVKEEMEKLEFGCKYIAKNYHPEIFWEYSERIYTWTTHWDWIKEIIWLPLQERFIRIYCEKTNNPLIFTHNSIWTVDFKDECLNRITELDNTKDFSEQSEEVYQKIYEALYNLNK